MKTLAEWLVDISARAPLGEEDRATLHAAADEIGRLNGVISETQNELEYWKKRRAFDAHCSYCGEVANNVGSAEEALRIAHEHGLTCPKDPRVSYAVTQFAEGFKAARKAASSIVVEYTDGDSPFDGTIARMAEEIDRLVPEVTERHAASPAPTECVHEQSNSEPRPENCKHGKPLTMYDGGPTSADCVECFKEAFGHQVGRDVPEGGSTLDLRLVEAAWHLSQSNHPVSAAAVREAHDKIFGPQDDARDAARYRWWRKWWCDNGDDCERVNSLEYDTDEPATFDAAIDAEIRADDSQSVACTHDWVAWTDGLGGTGKRCSRCHSENHS